jgi:hypothetical protein
MVAYELTSGGEHEASKFVIFITYLSQVSGTFDFSTGELDLVYECSCIAPYTNWGTYIVLSTNPWLTLRDFLLY